MRKLYSLTIAMVCITIVSNAQISKGSIFLGGSVSCSQGENENESPSSYESKSSHFQIRPQFGKAISTNKILGLFMNYGASGFEESSSNNFTQQKTKTYGGGIFLRSYYPLNSRFYLFGEGDLGVNFSNYERTSNSISNSADNATEFGLAITPGIAFAAGKKLHLEASLNNLFSIDYRLSKITYYDNSGAVSSSAKGTNVSAAANANGFSQISVGLRWMLPSKS